jgi:ATP-binding cassette subfamily F protein 3
MIQLNSLSLDVGTRPLFSDLNTVFHTNDRVGIIGRNGAGKSTLLKVIAGLMKPTAGKVTMGNNIRLGYLPQEEVLTSHRTVFDEAFSAFAVLVQTQARMHTLEAMLHNNFGTAELLEEYIQLQEVAQTLDKHTALQQTHEVLTGLGFTLEAFKKSVNALSVGWKMRLALAKLLLTDADIFLFDEPTNHLDIVTQQWFLNKLKTMKEGFLLVSHDRRYLDNVCTSILELERGRGTYYRGNLQSYLQQKEEQLQINRATRARQEREIVQKQATVDRFRAGTRAQQAKNIAKQIKRIDLVEIEPPLPTIHFKFPTPARPGDTVLTFKNLTYSFSQIPLFQRISGYLERGERVALVAANGVGKTTLINCIAGNYRQQQGTVTFGHGVKAAFFEQDQARALKAENTVLEELILACPQTSELEIRKILGSFQFGGDDAYKKTSVLSGGEKNRVAMIKVLLQRANLLILDEPTNHLDLYAKDVLRQALEAYEGTFLFVSHDLDFVSTLANRVIELTPTAAHSYLGTYEEFCAAKQAVPTYAIPKMPSSQPLEKISSAPSKEQTLKKQLTHYEQEIMRLERDEKRQAELLSKHVYGSTEYTKVANKLLDIQKKLVPLHDVWEGIVKKLDELGKIKI